MGPACLQSKLHWPRQDDAAGASLGSGDGPDESAACGDLGDNASWIDEDTYVLMVVAVGSRCRRKGQGGYLTGLSEIRFGIGFGEVWTRELVQTLSQTYLGGTRDSF